MRPSLSTALLSFAAMPLLVSMPFDNNRAYAQTPGAMELKRVVFSTGGVGYFEFESLVGPDQDVAIDAPLKDIDDILKSLVVYDGAGRVGSARLNGRTPLRDVFEGLPFNQEDLASVSRLLTRMQGAEIIVGGVTDTTGRVLAVEPFTLNLEGGTTITEHRVTLVTETGLENFVLEDADTIRFSDERLQRQIDDALRAILESQTRERRAISIELSGGTERTVRLGYVTGAPLWKATYRLTVDPSQTGRVGVQGWAVMENVSGRDWDEVALSVISGNPVTFTQALYDPYFVQRPAVPVEVVGRILPPPDTGAVALDGQGRAGVGPQGAALRAPAAETAELGMAMDGLSQFRASGRVAALATAPQAPALDAMASPAPQQAAITEAAGTETIAQVRFDYPEPVTVANGQSIMLPLIDRAIEAELISVYRPTVHQRHPLASIAITNDGATALPPGVVTVYERLDGTDGTGSFAGDAQLSALPAGDERLLSYAVDQAIEVQTERDQDQRYTAGSIVDGLLRLTQTITQETRYTISGDPQRARDVVIEHPKIEGWSLAGLERDGLEETQTAYRIPVTVPAGDVSTLTVRLERPQVQRLEMINLTNGEIAVFANARTLSDELRQAIARLADLQGVVQDRERAVNQASEAVQRLSEQTERVRRLLGTVPRNADLYGRYLGDLEDLEDQIAEAQNRADTARDALERARVDVFNYARGLEIGGTTE